jgi:hypothetical protein
LEGGNVQSLWLADAVTGETTELVPSDKLGTGGRIQNIVWSPDSSQIAFDCCFGDPDADGLIPGSIKVVTVATGELETVGETTGGIAGRPNDFCWEDGVVTTEVEWWMGYCSRIHYIEPLAVISKDRHRSPGQPPPANDR